MWTVEAREYGDLAEEHKFSVQTCLFVFEKPSTSTPDTY